MFDQLDTVQFSMPNWLIHYAQQYHISEDVNHRAEFVIGAAKQNIEQESGGPFAAAVFELGSNKLVSLGVNIVTAQGLSMLHAEMVALTLAQRKIGSYDLATEGFSMYELVTSSEPCAMCFGAIPWSGVKQVVTCAYAEDAEQVGFDEGSKPEHWVEALKQRDINVITNIQREKARKVLQAYKEMNGSIYNARNDSSNNKNKGKY